MQVVEIVQWNCKDSVFYVQGLTENLDKHKDLIGKANKELEDLRVQKDALQNERK
jgi:hypothetical protein